MSGEAYLDILHQEGFEQLGRLKYRLDLSIWWNSSPDHLMQLLMLALGDHLLIKADKSYYLKSVSEAGETWARDIGLLHEYLENHFPEIRIAFSHFRDVPAALAEREVRRRLSVQAPTVVLPTVEEVAQLQQQLHAKERAVRSDDAMAALSSGPRDSMSAYLHHRSRLQKAEVQQLEDRYRRRKEKLDILHHLQNEYRRKGSAAVYTFNISSSLQICRGADQFQDAVRAVVKEIQDQHRYHVTQKLQGGRLNIQLSEAGDPAVAWIEQWLGGTLSPSQVERLGAARLNMGVDHVIVTPDEPIVVDGHVQAAEKRLAARMVSTVMGNLDKTEAVGQTAMGDPDKMSADTMPLRIGLLTDGKGVAVGPAVLPLAHVVHALVSGTTGSGKSFLARVLVEEASSQQGLNVLVLDPRNQFVGLLVPEDRQQVLDQYEEFGLDPGDTRGFAFEYFAPARQDLAPPMKDVALLATSRSIVSFKGMNDRDRCALAAEILNGVFEAASSKEADRPQLLILVDESQLLLRKRVDDESKDAAARSEIALDRIAREGRKYGVVLVLVSQSMKDFSHELATIRQMANTKIFLRNSDREIDYASDFIADGRFLVNLPTGTALIHNAALGIQYVRVRPPRSKVYELPDSEIRQLMGRSEVRTQLSVSLEARELLAIIKTQCPPRSHLNMSQLASLAGITSKRKLQNVVRELEGASLIYTRTLAERGQPRVVGLPANECCVGPLSNRLVRSY